MTKRWIAAMALAGCCLQGVHAAPIPFKRDSDVPAATVVGGGAGILLVSGLAIAAVLVLRRRLRLPLPLAAGQQRHLRVLESQRMGPQATLAVVEFSGKRYLLAQGVHGVSCLDSVPLEGTQQ